MIKQFCTLIFCCFTTALFAQVTISGNAIPSVQFSDVNGRSLPIGKTDVLGNPYAFDNFAIGKLLFTNGMEAVDSNINYSYFDHQLYFTKNNGLYMVNMPVKAFELKSMDRDNNLILKKFVAGYPNVEDNTLATYYELLANGTAFQLLKYTNKRIKESTVYGSAPVKEYVADDLFYIYVQATKKMLPLGSALNLKNIKKALPEKANQLDELMKQYALNIKREEDIKQLFEKLN